MRSILFCSITVFLLAACHKPCDSYVHKPVPDAGARAWEPDSVTAPYTMMLGSVERVFTPTGKRQNWYYPEKENPCNDLYLTAYSRYLFQSDTVTVQYIVEQNDASGQRIRVNLMGYEFISPLQSSSGSIQVPQSNGSIANITYNQLDSFVVDTFTYKPVKVMEMLTSSPDPFRVYITPHWGLVRYELPDGSYWDRKR